MMRTILPLFALSLAGPAMAQQPTTESPGLPGAHFSLERALDLFKRNFEMERFEQELNTDSTGANNLDLDGDGMVDFLRVVGLPREGGAVVIVVRALVGANEEQDVAVILVGESGVEGGLVQIRGDEDLYTPKTFVEPIAEGDSLARDPSPTNVWSWRPVPWCFSPRYYAYVSPWKHKEKPHWWQAVPVRTGSPDPGDHLPGAYRPWGTCRLPRALDSYTPHRERSAIVESQRIVPAKKEP